jgi:mRNA interferase MazF
VKRGDLYLVRRPGSGDPRKRRVFVIVSRQTLIERRYSTVICAPVYSEGHGLHTEVAVGIEDGLKHPSWIACDNLASLSKRQLTDYVGCLSPAKLQLLSRALRVALDLA